MTAQQHPEPSRQPIDDTQVADYLRRHSDFFDRHPDVLAEIELSHTVGKAVSLIERQVQTLRQQNRKAKAQLEELIQIARENDRLSERMHRLTLALMDTHNLDEVYVALHDSLRGEFQVEAVTIRLFVDPTVVNVDDHSDLMQMVFVPMNDPRLGEFKTILGQNKPVCGPLRPEQIQYLFGDGAEGIQSTALVPFGGDFCRGRDCPFLGMVAIGSQNPQRFVPNMGTLFLTHLGEIIGRAVRRHLHA